MLGSTDKPKIFFFHELYHDISQHCVNVADPAFQDTSSGAPQFMLATGGNDNLVKLWDIFTASGTNASIVMQFFVYFFHW